MKLFNLLRRPHWLAVLLIIVGTASDSEAQHKEKNFWRSTDDSTLVPKFGQHVIRLHDTDSSFWISANGLWWDVAAKLDSAFLDSLHSGLLGGNNDDSVSFAYRIPLLHHFWFNPDSIYPSIHADTFIGFYGPKIADSAGLHARIYWNNAGWPTPRYSGDTAIFSHLGWMIQTPLDSEVTSEEPTLFVTDDSTTWYRPYKIDTVGSDTIRVPEPLCPDPPGTCCVNSDPEILVDHYDSLRIYWRWTNTLATPDSSMLFSKASTDGISFSDSVLVAKDTGDAGTLMGPSVIYCADGLYRLWTVWVIGTSPNDTILALSSSTTPTGFFPDDTIRISDTVHCSFSNFPAGRQLWHITIDQIDGLYVMSITTDSVGSDLDHKQYLAISTDGQHWLCGSTAYLTGNKTGGVGNWDSTYIYTTELVPRKSVDRFYFDVYYTGYHVITGSPHAGYHIGYTHLELKTGWIDNDGDTVAGTYNFTDGKFDSIGTIDADSVVIDNHIIIGGDAISDFSGTGLQVTANSLQAVLGTSIISSEIVNNTILEEDLATDHAQADEYVLSWETGTGGTMTWQKIGNSNITTGLNDSIGNGVTAYGWGNHASAGYATQTWTNAAIEDSLDRYWDTTAAVDTAELHDSLVNYGTQTWVKAAIEDSLDTYLLIADNNDNAASLTNIQTACTNDFHNIGGMDDDNPDTDAEVPDAITVNPINSATENAIEFEVDLIDLQGILNVSKGGTGNSTLTDGGVLVGNGTSAVQITSVGTSGQVLTSNGAGSDPTFQNVSQDVIYTNPFFIGTAEMTGDPAVWNHQNQLDINNVSASHADTFEFFPTPASCTTTNCGTHPSIIYCPLGILGTRWQELMFYTPLEGGPEEPCLIVRTTNRNSSDTGWTQFYRGSDSSAYGDGYDDSTLLNPVFTYSDFAGIEYLSDPDIFFTDDGQLGLLLRATSTGTVDTNFIIIAISPDGLDWSDTTRVINCRTSSYIEDGISPSILMDTSGWYKLWMLDKDGNGENKIRLFQTQAPDGTWDFVGTTDLMAHDTTNADIWHFDILKNGPDEYVALIMECVEDGSGTFDTAQSDLYIATSPNGLTGWSVPKLFIKNKSTPLSAFDYAVLYRPTGYWLEQGTGKALKVYYGTYNTITYDVSYTFGKRHHIASSILNFDNENESVPLNLVYGLGKSNTQNCKLSLPMRVGTDHWNFINSCSTLTGTPDDTADAGSVVTHNCFLDSVKFSYKQIGTSLIDSVWLIGPNTARTGDSTWWRNATDYSSSSRTNVVCYLDSGHTSNAGDYFYLRFFNAFNSDYDTIFVANPCVVVRKR